MKREAISYISPINVVTDPTQIATNFSFPQFILEKFLDQDTKNAPECLLGKYAKFA